MKNRNKEIILIGIGNELRKDDGVGIVIVRELKKRVPNGISFYEFHDDSMDIMEQWKGYHTAYIFDATSSGVKPGTIYRFLIPKDKLHKNIFGISTHTLNISDTIELARILNCLPKQIILYGIEGEIFEQGKGLSSTVNKAAQEVIQEVQKEITTPSIPISGLV
jgi:hydrogenase maturation protease